MLWQLSLNLNFMDWRLGSGCGDAAGKSSGSTPSVIWLQPVARGAGPEREGIQVHHCSPQLLQPKAIWSHKCGGLELEYKVLALWAEDDGMMSGCNDSNALSALWVLNLKGPMECFHNSLDLFHMSIQERAHRNVWHIWRTQIRFPHDRWISLVTGRQWGWTLDTYHRLPEGLLPCAVVFE